MAAETQRKNSGLLTLAATVTAVAGIAAAVLIFMGIRGEQLLRSDVIFPNISISGIPVGGMTPGEAALAVQSAVQGQYTADFEVRLPDRTVILEADKLSVTADAQSAAAQAAAYGRQGTAFDALAAYNEACDLRADVALTFDEGYIRQVLDAAAKETAVEMTLPKAERNYREKTIAVTLGTVGRSLDTEALFAAVLSALTAGETSLSWSYATVPAPAPDLAALHEATGQIFDLALAQAALSQCADGESFTIPTE